MKKVNEIIARFFDGQACNFYRALVPWMDSRGEHINSNKSFRKLAIKYAKHIEKNFG